MAKKAAARRAASTAKSGRLQGKAGKYVYFFGNGKAEGNRHMVGIVIAMLVYFRRKGWI